MCKFTRSSLKQGRKEEPNTHCEKLGHLGLKKMRNCYGGLLWKWGFQKEPCEPKKA
jgi:hypothetical protein